MGQCASSKSAKCGNILGDDIPMGTLEMLRTGPSFDYTVLISNIKLKDVPYESVSGRITIGRIFETDLPKRSDGKVVKV